MAKQTKPSPTTHPAQEDSEFPTCDLNIIAFLLTKGCEVSRVQRSDTAQKSIVYFTDTGECKDLAVSYLSRKGTVVAADFADAFRQAKDLVFGRAVVVRHG